MRARLAFSRDRRVSPVPSSTRVEGHLDVVAGLDFDLTALVLELLERDDGFGLEADVDDDDVGTDVDHQAGEDHAGANALIRQALLRTVGQNFRSYASLRTPCVADSVVLSASCQQGLTKQAPASVRTPTSTSPRRAGQPRASWPKATSDPSPAPWRRPPRRCSPVESRTTASAAGRRGATAGSGSRRSRSGDLARKGGKVNSGSLVFQLLIAPAGPFLRGLRSGRS